MEKYVNYLNVVVLMIAFVWVTWTDLKYKKIKNELIIGLLCYSIYWHHMHVQHYFYAFILIVPLLLISIFTKMIGLGDVKLIWVIVSIIGFEQGTRGLGIGLILAGMYACLKFMLKQGDRKSKIAYGPFLMIGFLVSFI